jgi:hypothetical protein
MFLGLFSLFALLVSCGFVEETDFLLLNSGVGDIDAPSILSVSPADGGKVDAGAIGQIDITYSEAVNGADVLSNYVLSGSGSGGLSLDSVVGLGLNSYRVNVSGIPGDGPVVLTISSVVDTAGNGLAGNTLQWVGWWDTRWTSRRGLTFNNSGQGEDLQNFPVLVLLDATRIDYGKTQGGGEDLRFLDTDRTVLSHEIESWDESGESVVWVKVPQIDGSSAIDFIWMYYGNDTIGDGQDEVNVWDDNYLGVWHLNESSGPINDSTFNNDGTNNGASFNTSEIIAGAYDFNGNGDAIETNSYTYNFDGEITLEAWFKYSGSGTGSPRILEISQSGNADSHCLAPDGDGSLRAWVQCDSGSRVASADDSTNYNDGEWHYMVYSYSNPNGKLYVDGNETDTPSGTCSNLMMVHIL